MDVKEGRFACHFSDCHVKFYHARKLADHYSTEHDLRIGIDKEQLYITRVICHFMQLLTIENLLIGQHSKSGRRKKRLQHSPHLSSQKERPLVL